MPFTPVDEQAESFQKPPAWSRGESSPNERQNKHVFLAEAYTDVPGEYVTVKETVRSFKSLLEDR